MLRKFGMLQVGVCIGKVPYIGWGTVGWVVEIP